MPCLHQSALSHTPSYSGQMNVLLNGALDIVRYCVERKESASSKRCIVFVTRTQDTNYTSHLHHECRCVWVMGMWDEYVSFSPLISRQVSRQELLVHQLCILLEIPFGNSRAESFSSIICIRGPQSMNSKNCGLFVWHSSLHKESGDSWAMERKMKSKHASVSY